MPKKQFYNEYDDNEEDRLPSRSEIKREAMAFQKLGEKVIELSNKDFAKVALWPELEDAILLARRLPNKDAKRRQIRLIGKLLRTGEHEDISKALKAIVTGAPVYDEERTIPFTNLISNTKSKEPSAGIKLIVAVKLGLSQALELLSTFHPPPISTNVM